MRHWRSTCSMGCPKPRSMPSESADTSSASRTWVRSASRAMEDGLDVVAVRIQHEGPVVARVVELADAGRAVVGAAGGERRRVERVDRLAVLDPERNVHAAVGPATALRDPEEGEVVAEAADVGSRLHQDTDPER